MVGCGGIYLPKLHPVAIFSKVENLSADLYMDIYGEIFVLLLQYSLLLCLPPIGDNYLMNRTRLGPFLS